MKEPRCEARYEARLNNEKPRVAGRAVAQRSLVSIQAQSGSSGGIGYAQCQPQHRKRNVDRLGGIGIGSGSGGAGAVAAAGAAAAAAAAAAAVAAAVATAVATGRVSGLAG